MPFSAGDLVARLKLDLTGFKAGLKGAGTELSALEKQTIKNDGVFKGLSITAGNLARTLGPALGLGALILGFREVTKEAAEFESEFANVNTLLNETDETIKGLKDGILDMSVDVVKSTTDLTRGLYQVVSAGVDTADALDVLRVSAIAATAGMSDTFTSVDAITTILNAYGLSASKATDVSDLLFQTVNLGKTTFSQLAGAIGTVISPAASVGVKLEDLFATIATLTKGGIDTRTTMTALRAVLMSILKPTDEAIAMAGHLRLEWTANAIAAKGLVQFLNDIKTATKGDTEKIAKLVPEARALNAVLSATGAQSKSLSESFDKMGKSAGSSEKAFAKQLDTFEKQSERLGIIADKIQVKIGSEFLPVLTLTIKGIIKLYEVAGEELEKFEKKLGFQNIGKIREGAEKSKEGGLLGGSVKISIDQINELQKSIAAIGPELRVLSNDEVAQLKTELESAGVKGVNAMNKISEEIGVLSKEMKEVKLTPDEQAALDKQLEGIKEFHDKYKKAVENAEVAITRHTKGEHAARLQEIENFKNREIEVVREALNEQLALVKEGSEQAKQLNAAAIEAGKEILKIADLQTILTNYDEYQQKIEDIASILESRLSIAKEQLNAVTENEASTVGETTLAYRIYENEIIQATQINKNYLQQQLSAMQAFGASQQETLKIQKQIVDQETASLQARLSAWQGYYDDLSAKAAQHTAQAEQYAQKIIALEQQKLNMTISIEEFATRAIAARQGVEQQYAAEMAILENNITMALAAEGEERVRLFAQAIEQQKSIISRFGDETRKATFSGFSDEPLIDLGTALQRLFQLGESYKSAVDSVAKAQENVKQKQEAAASAAKSQLPEIANIIKRIEIGLTQTKNEYSNLINLAKQEIKPVFNIQPALNAIDGIENAYFNMKRTIESNPIVQVIQTRRETVEYAEGGIVPGHLIPINQPIPLQHGGILSSPTTALIAEAGTPEAVIPLKGGAVPVTFVGAGVFGGGKKQYIVNYNAPVPLSQRVEEEYRVTRMFGQLNKLDARLSQ